MRVAVVAHSGYPSSLASATVPSHLREVAAAAAAGADASNGASDDVHPLGQTVAAARHTPLPLANGDLVLRMNASGKESGHNHSTDVATFSSSTGGRSATSGHAANSAGQPGTVADDQHAHSQSGYSAMSVSTKKNSPPPPPPPPPHPSFNDHHDAGTLSVSQLSTHGGHAQDDETASGRAEEDDGRTFGATPTIPVRFDCPVVLLCLLACVRGSSVTLRSRRRLRFVTQ